MTDRRFYAMVPGVQRAQAAGFWVGFAVSAQTPLYPFSAAKCINVDSYVSPPNVARSVNTPASPRGGLGAAT